MARELQSHSTVLMSLTMRTSLLTFLAMMAVASSAWTTGFSGTHPFVRARSKGTTSSAVSRLYNIPPPSVNDVDAFKKYADKQPPPASFFELQQDCTKAALLALRDGHKLIEVEFPPLPANVLEMDDVSAYEISYANLNLAIDFAKGIMVGSTQDDGTSATKSFSKVAILFPDEAEAEIAAEKMLGGSKSPYPGITIAALRQSEEGDDRMFKVRKCLCDAAQRWNRLFCSYSLQQRIFTSLTQSFLLKAGTTLSKPVRRRFRWFGQTH
jgi:hypothetical protein